MNNSIWPDITDIRSCTANCHTCVFKKNNGKIPYCVLKRFPILNPDVGCSRRMVEKDFDKSNIKQVSAEEIDAYTAAKIKDDRFDI